MAVYPFYIDTNADGRKTRIAGGTRRKDGSMRTVLTQRNHGSIMTAFTIECNTVIVGGKEKLVSSVYNCDGDLVAELYTDY